MPTSKSLISNEEADRAEIERLAAANDYKALLDLVLAHVHRDGGQYTILAGYAASVELAIFSTADTRRKLAAVSARLSAISRNFRG